MKSTEPELITWVQIHILPLGSYLTMDNLLCSLCQNNNLSIWQRKWISRKSRKLRAPKKLDPRRNTPRHIIITLPRIKQKERILEAAREKDTVTYKGVPLKLSADFPKENLQAERGWKEVFKVMKSKDLHPRLLYPAKLSFSMEGQIKCFSDKVELKQFIITKPLLYEMLKGLI